METIKKVLARDRFAANADIVLISVSPGQAVAEMKVTERHYNGLGTAQGGAIFTLADFAFAAASNSHGTVAVAINVSITFMKAVNSGVLRAEAREITKNFKLGSYTVEVKDEVGDIVALFQGTAYRKADKHTEA